MDHTELGLNLERFIKFRDSSPSLELLRPESSIPPSTIAAPTATSRHLEEISREVIKCFCTQDWDNPVLEKHATENFQGYLEYCSAQTWSLQEHVELHKKIHKSNPGYEFDVRSCDMDVNEDRGLATAWIVLVVTGYPLKIERESMTVLWWRRRLGVWRCYKQCGLRGINWFPAVSTPCQVMDTVSDITPS